MCNVQRKLMSLTLLYFTNNCVAIIRVKCIHGKELLLFYYMWDNMHVASNITIQVLAQIKPFELSHVSK